MPRSTKMRAMKTITLGLAATFLGLGPSMGRAQADKHTLTCGPEKTIGQAIKTLKPGDTLLVSGTCNENLALGKRSYPRDVFLPSLSCCWIMIFFEEAFALCGAVLYLVQRTKPAREGRQLL